MKTKVISGARSWFLATLLFVFAVPMQLSAADAPQHADPQEPSTATPSAAAKKAATIPAAQTRTRRTNPALSKKDSAVPAADPSAVQPVAVPVPPAGAAFNPNPPAPAPAAPAPPNGAASTAAQALPAIMGAMQPKPSSSAAPKSQSQNRQDPDGSDTYGPNTSSGNFGNVCNSSGEAAKECNCEGENFKSLSGAIQASKDFREKNLQSSSSTKIAVNDYRSKIGCMYIVDVNDNSCYATTSAWGSGSNKGGNPQPGCTSGSLMSPAGFHVTAAHNGGKYNDSNCFGMQDLQGQGSQARGILIHQGSCNGGSTTWGCAGVGDFPKVKELLGKGSLVYNYFGETGVGNCTGATDASNYEGAPTTPKTDLDPEEDPEPAASKKAKSKR